MKDGSKASRDRDWKDAVTKASKLEPEYLNEHDSPPFNQDASQADAIERAFGNLSGGHGIGHTPELHATEESDRMVASWLAYC